MYTAKQLEILSLLDKYLSDTPSEQIQQDIQAINSLGIPGPTVTEYFDTFSERFNAPTVARSKQS